MDTARAFTSGIHLCVVYDQTKFPRFKEGSSVILRNVIKKPDGVAVTSNTKVFPCAEVSVPEHIVNQAKNLLHPPPAPTKTVSEALNSPPKERVSIKGTITQEEATRQVFVREERVNVKNIYIEDATSKCKVALWRSFAEKDIRPGDYVHITDVVINTFRNEVSLTTTSKTKITKTDCPPEVKVKQAVSGCVDGENMTFLLEDDTILTMPLELVEVALPNVEKEEIEINVAINKPAYQQYPVRGEERYEAGKAVDGRKSDLSSWGGQCTASESYKRTATWTTTNNERLPGVTYPDEYSDYVTSNLCEVEVYGE
uniref:Shieldin complex subunit 2 first OB fold domain-containing protein n=1 Tax=Magallana gigas TaxID=29159 RepID=K1R6C5_MAGGI